jgi:uncharacterized damage-inducible protein DinB
MPAAARDVNAAVLERFLAHNAWAIRVLLERCRSLAPAQFTQRFEIGPGSLHDTLLHVVGAMRRWADRIGGRTVRPSIEGPAAVRTPEEIIALLEDAAPDLAGVVRRVVEAGRLEERMEVRMGAGPEPFAFTRGTAIVHVITHGVHHAAQALNMLRRLGAGDLPEIDAIEWELEGVPLGGSGPGE